MKYLLLFDSITKEEMNYIENLFTGKEYVVKSLEDVNEINYSHADNIVLFCGINLNFISSNVLNFINKINSAKITKMQISIIFIENNYQNAEYCINWIKNLNYNYRFNIKILGEVTKEDLTLNSDLLKQLLNFDESIKENKQANHVTIYTDGACSGNPGAGGWGAILMGNGKKKELSGYDPETTNNKMELTAVIKALEALKSSCTVDLYSDSAYVVNAINQNWLDNWKKNNWIGSDKKPVKNIELWKGLDFLLSIHSVTFIKVKGHSDNEYNNRCDELATGEISKHANI